MKRELAVDSHQRARDTEVCCDLRQPVYAIALRGTRKIRGRWAKFALYDVAVATSGDYWHWVEVGDCRLSHTMDPGRGGPLGAQPASVTVVNATCIAADAWATALMVKGSLEGAELARRYGLDALFIDRGGDHLRETRVGRLFETGPDPGPVV